MRTAFRAIPFAAMLAVAGCTSIPTGPSILVLPGTGKSFDQFRVDDYTCKQFAQDQVGGRTTRQYAADSGVTSAVVGTAVGALAGAAFDGGRGAATGAGAGLLIGSAAGAGSAQSSGSETQRRYDFAYQQCMYANGHRVPVSGRYEREPVYRTTPPPPPPGSPPPPPPGAR